VRAQRPFLILWTLAVAASVAAFVLHLALRGRNVELGYELGKARGEQGRLREIKRVLELEAASYETPQRVEVVARTLLGMQPPAADRIIPIAGVAVGPERTAPPAPKSNAPSSPRPVNTAPIASARAER
jgi:cell division protein FtsL